MENVEDGEILHEDVVVAAATATDVVSQPSDENYRKPLAVSYPMLRKAAESLILMTQDMGMSDVELRSAISRAMFYLKSSEQLAVAHQQQIEILANCHEAEKKACEQLINEFNQHLEETTSETLQPPTVDTSVPPPPITFNHPPPPIGMPMMSTSHELLNVLKVLPPTNFAMPPPPPPMMMMPHAPYNVPFRTLTPTIDEGKSMKMTSWRLTSSSSAYILQIAFRTNSAATNARQIAPCVAVCESTTDEAMMLAEGEHEAIMDEVLLSSKLKRVDSATGVSSPRSNEPLVTGKAAKVPKTPYVVLPAAESFAKFRSKSRVAVDIGGTLIKVVYSSTCDDELPEESLNGGNRNYAYEDGKKVLVNFKKFTQMDKFINFLKENWVDRTSEDVIHCTGGGSYKFAEQIKKELGVKIARTDEMRSLIYGVNFLLNNNVDESFTYHHDAIGRNKFQYRPIDKDLIYPFLLVNIGTGISILKVDSPEKYERVGGSSMGGGTFLGLGSLLTPAKSFDELLELASRGDHRNVDKLVCDIYGGSYEELKLKADLIAGSLAKCSSYGGATTHQHKPEDIAKSLLLMVSNNIGQMAMLYGTRFGLKRIYFGGFFIRQDPITMRTLSYAINFWSGGAIDALYLKHEGYLGAMGSFLDEDGVLEDV
ncbi:unnamed protein product [Caenorhabditis bovis]|uniref:pantothenate kinase n=1 Tax=Caenorhabditis bovis TaxID=2654633 RepID=A0A8S1F3S7_9PELO|nr:unnamed protein product [Caenorhabditis bovis]